MRAFLRKMRGWRTMLFAILLAVGGVLEAADWASIVPKEHVGSVVLVIAVVMAVLRLVTTGPVGQK